MVNNNYEVAWQHYSYSVLRNQLSAIINDFFNEHEHQQQFNKLSNQRQVIYLNNDPYSDPYDPLNEKTARHMPN